MSYYTRLSFNSNDWVSPSGSAGKCHGASANPIWECMAGFGFEEWYRSPEFRKIEGKDQWQYGYWQCFRNPNNHQPGQYNNLLVYTRECDGNCKPNAGSTTKVVATYKQITVLSADERMNAEIFFAESLNSVRNELTQLGINVNQWFDPHPIGFPKINIKYKLEDESYQFDNSQLIVLNRGGYRFGLYNVNQ